MAKIDLDKLIRQSEQRVAVRQAPPELYRYGVPYRPIGYATVPDGYAFTERADPTTKGYTRYGIVVYDRPLTHVEIKGFQLVPIVNLDALVEAVIRELGYPAEHLELWRGDSSDRVQATMAVGHAWDRTGKIALGVTRQNLAEQVYAELELRQGRAG